MSGNMSDLSKRVGLRGLGLSQQQQPLSSSTGGYNGRARESSGNTSFSFTDGSSILSSFVEEADQSKIDLEAIVDNDAWGNRVVLGALTEIAFSEVPHPKLPPDVIQGLQKFLLNVNSAVGACNPFLERQKNGNVTTGEENDICNVSLNKTSDSGSQNDIPSVELPKELVDALGPECRVVLRSLVGAYVRKQMGKISEFWKPILELNGTTVPELSDATRVQRRSVCPPSESKEAKQLFDLILKQTKVYKNRSHEISGEMEELLRRRNEEMKKYERDVKIFKELTLQDLKEHKAVENPEFIKQYQEYLDLKQEHVTQQIRLEKLKMEEEERGTETEQSERQVLYSQVKTKFEDIKVEAEEMEERLLKCKSLGSPYQELLKEYKSVEEQIKLKEWVLEQLANVNNDESLFSD